MEKRYTALRVIGTIYKVIGGIIGVITLLGAIGLCLAGILSGASVEMFAEQLDLPMMGGGFVGGALFGVIGAVVLILYGGGLALTLFALGESIFLLVALEENTRQTAVLLMDQARRAAVGPMMAPPAGPPSAAAPTVVAPTGPPPPQV